MFKSLLSFAAFIELAVNAQTDAEKAAYPEYTPEFAKWGYTWEPIKLHTEDGYTLTMFHITGTVDNGPIDITKNAVILQHGMGGSGNGWLVNIVPGPGNKEKPMSFQLADLGYDVYMTNNSGVKYSQEHDVYTVYDREFWQMDWRKYGVYDLPAAVAEIQKRNGGAKVAYVGHSQGTTQTFAGIAQIPEWYDENISMSVLMGPCTSPNQKYFVDMYNPTNFNFLKENDIFAFGGPNWEVDKAKIMASGNQDLIDSMGTMEHLPNNPVQAVEAYAQASMSNRFQEYTDDWFTYSGYPESFKKTPLLDIGLTQKTKITMMVGLFDDTCPLPVAEETKKNLGPGTIAEYMVMPWQGHVPFGFSHSPWFMRKMDKLLQMNQ